MSTTRARASLLLAALTLLGGLAHPPVGLAASPPVKEILATHIGWEVDATTGGGICTASSGDSCRFASESAQPGGFAEPRSVAVDNDPASPDYGDLYVADAANHRIQQLSAGGAFIAMFGWDVNRTKVEEGAPQAERDLCTAQSKDVCQAGSGGEAPEQLLHPFSVTLDPASGNLYVAESERERSRVQEFTAGGAFVLELGKEVNASTKGNLCTAEEITHCTASAPILEGEQSGGHGAFNFASNDLSGNAISVGGPNDLLYVGEAGHVEELTTAGVWVGEIGLVDTTGGVQALAVDPSGDIYLVMTNSAVVQELNPAGGELQSVEVQPHTAGATIYARALALDASGQLAVAAEERLGGERGEFGVLLAAASGHRITDFTIPLLSPADGVYIFVSALAFDAQGDLYAAATSPAAAEVLGYTAVPVAELAASQGACALEGEVDAAVAFRCTLAGEANPEGVAETGVFFEWGRTPALGANTAEQSVAAAGPVSAVLDGLRPNETFHYQLAGVDRNVRAPEALQSEQAQVSTEAVAPRVLAGLSAAFVSSSSAVLAGTLDPENTQTTYAFQYAPACSAGEECPALAQAPEMRETPTLRSGLYGDVPVELEASGLQPATTYRYRLTAVNEKGEAAVAAGDAAQLPEATFTTAPVPAPSVAGGAASVVGVSSATIAGAVDPGGLPATYAFELGVEEGAGTDYVVVFSGSAGAGSQPLPEQLQLTGLQPGTTYAYRIEVQSGYVENGEHTLRSEPVLFTTGGLSAVLVVPSSLPLLAVPDIVLPGESVARGGKAKKGGEAKKRGKAKRRKVVHRRAAGRGPRAKAKKKK
jgi:hypothetical protein